MADINEFHFLSSEFGQAQKKPNPWRKKVDRVNAMRTVLQNNAALLSPFPSIEFIRAEQNPFRQYVFCKEDIEGPGTLALSLSKPRLQRRGFWLWFPFPDSIIFLHVSALFAVMKAQCASVFGIVFFLSKIFTELQNCKKSLMNDPPRM